MIEIIIIAIHIVVAFFKDLWMFITRRETIRVGHRSCGTLGAIKKAKRRIVLHAAFYPYYMDSGVETLWRETLKKRPGLKVEIFHLSLQPDWCKEFTQTLRPGWTLDQFEYNLIASRTFFEQRQADFPDQVFLYTITSLPCFPLVIIDDKIYVGHYAHGSKVNAPEGYWLTIKANVEDLIKYVSAPDVLILKDKRAQAASRFIAEYVHARNTAQRDTAKLAMQRGA